MKRYRFGYLSMGWQIMIGLTLGTTYGLTFYRDKGATTVMQNLGTIFTRPIQMIVMPIVVSYLTARIANIGNIRKSGRTGGKTLIYSEVLATVALVLGIVMVNIIRSGSFIDIHKLHAIDISQYISTAKSTEHSSGFWSLILSTIPMNIFKLMSDSDMMPVILSLVLFGLGIVTVGEKTKTLIDVCLSYASPSPRD